MGGLPEIAGIGWFHTIVGVLALVTGIYTFAKHKVIELDRRVDQVYLASTFIAAATALMIFRHGFFGPAHGLAVLTLLALIAGTVAAKTNILGKLSPYVQAMSFSATFLFHMIPAITDGLMRLPAGDPIVKDIEDPLLRGFYLAFLIMYVVGFAMQVMWLRKRAD